MAIDIFSPRQISAALMLSGHCPNKLMPCRTCFIWANTWSTKVFNCASGNPGWAAASPVRSSAKIRSASLILGKASWPLMVFSIIATRWLVILAGAERTVATCPCLALLSRISATRRKRSAFATDVPPNFNTRMVVTSLPLVEKKPALSGAGFFLCFLYASARTVTCGNGDGGGNGGANAFHGCCVLCNFYLSVRYAYIG